MIAEKLKKIRKSKRITQDEIADFLGVKRQTYSAYERRVSIPDSLTLKKLADYFEVTTDYFFTSSDARPESAQTEQEKRMLMLARRAEKIPPGQRDRLLKSFEDNIEMYLEALGINTDDAGTD